MTTSVTSTSAASSASSDPISSAVGGNSALGQDAFMKLLMAQIQNQDPLNPTSDTEFVSQLAQFSSVEQQTNSNKLLELLSTQQSGLANTADINLVGKTVTLSGNTLNSQANGFAIPGTFSLGTGSAQTTVQISDASGNTVRTLNLGAEPAGSVSFAWDGKNDTGNVQPAGSYTVTVTAKDSTGASVTVNQQTTGVVQSVSFGSNGATLTLADGTQSGTSNLVSVAATPTTATTSTSTSK